ncbi:nuclear transport factor 2 family protein [Frankia sp. AgB1.9]|uniref:nuclear transport factor 2 family protein n=1 Tax=unclassified Frankia TaxID=2632575 RepID=UPI00193333C1|nr:MULTISPECIES: nuclear transport factor 2 family protein [unclassified Frankia]MBL7488237.1 nuclear transport factor 2 family protein [Frankia sp. AgW1.1]MBL7548120.1 nuclear transport factor 2 family protein [Frankia sp. AgB1.9]MBL7620346.1 nuclear transport factor 2 family protein [Frankia sp. AgB1.8]
MTELTPAEVMEVLAASWRPDAMSDPATAERWATVFADDIVLVEPESLPHGGVHRGLAAFRAVQAGMRAHWDQRIEATEYWRCAPDLFALRIVIRWTARATGRSVVLPMIDMIRIRGGQIVEIEAYIHDTKALLETLDQCGVEVSMNSGPGR